MSKACKVKLTSRIGGGRDCLVFEAYVEAGSLDAAKEEAQKRLKAAVAKLAGRSEIGVDKVKIEQGDLDL